MRKIMKSLFVTFAICLGLAQFGCLSKVEQYTKIEGKIVSAKGVSYRLLTNEEKSKWGISNKLEKNPVGRIKNGEYLRGVVGDVDRSVLRAVINTEKGLVLYVRDDIVLPDTNEVSPAFIRPYAASLANSENYDITDKDLISKIRDIQTSTPVVHNSSDSNTSDFFFNQYYLSNCALTVGIHFVLVEESEDLFIIGNGMQSGYAIPVEDDAVKNCIIQIIQQMRLDGVVDY